MLRIVLGSYQERQPGCRALFLGYVYGVIGTVFHAAISHFCHDTDNHHVASALLPEFPSDWISAAKIMAHEFVVHNGDPRTVLAVPFVEISATEEGLP
jgi:hypothetical protein